MMDIFDIYLLEAVVNGILLGGLLALLALGLNLIFGVIDVTWICYAELVMIGMYGMYYLSRFLDCPITLRPLHDPAVAGLEHSAFAGDRAAAVGAAINQLLPGGVLSCCKASPPRVRHRLPQPRHSLPVLQFAEIASQLLPPARLQRGADRHGPGLSLMTRTYVGTAIRAISQDRRSWALMGVDTRRLYLITRRLAARSPASLLPAVLQYDIHPFVGCRSTSPS